MIAGLCVSPLAAYAGCELAATAVCNGSSCGSETRPVGRMIYNQDFDLIQVCRADGTWAALSAPGCPAGDGCSYASCTLDGVTVLHGKSEKFYSAEGHTDCASVSQMRSCNDGTLSGDPAYQYAGCSYPGPPDCPNIGDECDDDTYYIGAVGGHRVFAIGVTHHETTTWNNGTTNYATTGILSTTDGKSNTEELVALSDAGAPYEAAEYCDGLTAHGHSDWYLPAKDELNLFWNDGSPVAEVTTSGSYYWSSTEDSYNGAWIQRFSDGWQYTSYKNSYRQVRCVRSAE